MTHRKREREIGEHRMKVDDRLNKVYMPTRRRQIGTKIFCSNIWICTSNFRRSPANQYWFDGIAKPKEWHLNYCANRRWRWRCEGERKTGENTIIETSWLKLTTMTILASRFSHVYKDAPGKYNNFPFEWIAPTMQSKIGRKKIHSMKCCVVGFRFCMSILAKAHMHIEHADNRMATETYVWYVAIE